MKTKEGINDKKRSCHVQVFSLLASSLTSGDDDAEGKDGKFEIHVLDVDPRSKLGCWLPERRFLLCLVVCRERAE